MKKYGPAFELSSYLWGGLNILLLVGFLLEASERVLSSPNSGTMYALILLIVGWIGVMADFRPARWLVLILLAIFGLALVVETAYYWLWLDPVNVAWFAWLAISIYIAAWPLLPEKYTLRD